MVYACIRNIEPEIRSPRQILSHKAPYLLGLEGIHYDLAAIVRAGLQLHPPGRSMTPLVISKKDVCITII